MTRFHVHGQYTAQVNQFVAADDEQGAIDQVVPVATSVDVTHLHVDNTEQITIPLTLGREDWVELVHALASKWEMVEHMPDPPDHKWTRDLERIYNLVQARVEAEGIEC